MSQMNQKELQSYFTSLCESFYIVYRQVKRLEKEEQQLDKTAPNDELRVLNSLLEMPEQDENWQKYITSNYSKEELQARKKELEEALEEYNQRKSEVLKVQRNWYDIYDNITCTFKSLIYTFKNAEVTVKVSSKDEIYALMCFYSENSVIRFRVIDTDEKALKSFPSDKKKFQEFFEAYCLEDDERMKEVCNKYY